MPNHGDSAKLHPGNPLRPIWSGMSRCQCRDRLSLRAVRNWIFNPIGIIFSRCSCHGGENASSWALRLEIERPAMTASSNPTCGNVEPGRVRSSGPGKLYSKSAPGNEAGQPTLATGTTPTRSGWRQARRGPTAPGNEPGRSSWCSTESLDRLGRGPPTKGVTMPAKGRSRTLSLSRTERRRAQASLSPVWLDRPISEVSSVREWPRIVGRKPTTGTCYRPRL